MTALKLFIICLLIYLVIFILLSPHIYFLIQNNFYTVLKFRKYIYISSSLHL